MPQLKLLCHADEEDEKMADSDLNVEDEKANDFMEEDEPVDSTSQEAEEILEVQTLDSNDQATLGSSGHPMASTLSQDVSESEEEEMQHTEETEDLPANTSEREDTASSDHTGDAEVIEEEQASSDEHSISSSGSSSSGSSEYTDSSGSSSSSSGSSSSGSSDYSGSSRSSSSSRYESKGSPKGARARSGSGADPGDAVVAVSSSTRTSKNRNNSQFSSSIDALLEAMNKPVQEKEEAAKNIQTSPMRLKRGYVALNLASPQKSKSKLSTPPMRIQESLHSGKEERVKGLIDSYARKLRDGSKKDHVEKLVRKIDSLGGFQMSRRLSIRDNELVGRLIMAVRNDPRINYVEVNATVIGTISSTLLSQFIESLRTNVHVRSLSFQGVGLDNGFLYSLVASLESNLVVEEINLSTNLFTYDGLANFCQVLAPNNNVVKSLNLTDQTTPIAEGSEADVLEAFELNTSLTDVKIDFTTDEASDKLQSILTRNKSSSRTNENDIIDERLIAVLEEEAELAQERFDQKQEEENEDEMADHDWEYLLELAVLFDKHKLKNEAEEVVKSGFVAAPKIRANADGLSGDERRKFLFGAFQKNMEENVMAFNSDGSFLTPEFIAKYFKEKPEIDALEFDFQNQWKLFKRFPIHDPDRQAIVAKFVDAIVTHPRATEITAINMANTAAGNDFLEVLSARCLDDEELLPKLHTLNMETNYINETGVVALSKLIASPKSCKYMQVVRLENQKGLLKSKAEFALAKALRKNRSIVVLSLTIRNLLERERLIKYIMRNMDLIRQARQEHKEATGQQRNRNEVEKIFDKVRANDEEVTVVNMVGNKRFLTLLEREKMKAAKSFSHNSHVLELNLNGCEIDDSFAKLLGEAITTNFTLERLFLESNNLSGEGIHAIFEGLRANTSIKEVRLHKQSKLMASKFEESLADYLEKNYTITKLGIDLRSTMTKVQLDRLTSRNISKAVRERTMQRKASVKF